MLSKISLHITKINGKYSFSIQDHNRFPLAYEVFIKPPPQIRQGIVSKFEKLIMGTSNRMRDLSKERHKTKRELISEIDLAKEIGNDISSFLYPKEILNIINQMSPKSILLTTNDPFVPWELTGINNQFLSQKCSIGKCIKTSKTLNSIDPFNPKSRLEILLISNPTGDLIGADEEYQILSSFFENDIHFNLTTLHREKASLRNILELTRNKKFDIIHYAGHTSFDPDSNLDPVFHFADTNVSASYFASTLEQNCPKFLFLNSCTSALINSPDIYHNYLEGITPYFLHAGAIGIVGALWPIVDIDAIEIAKIFYQEIASSSSIGESLKMAKTIKILDNDVSVTWVGYTLVGDPDLVLVTDSQWKSKNLKTDGFSAAKNMFSGSTMLTTGGIHSLMASSQHHDTVILMPSSFCKKSEFLLVKGDKEINNIRELKGMRIGIPPLTSMEIYFRHLIADEGLEIDDFNIIYLNRTEIIPAIENDVVIAAMIWEPWLSYLLSKGYKIVQPKNTDINFTVCGILTRQKYLDNNLEGIKYAISNYFKCVEKINEKKINLSQLLSLQFDLPENIIKKSIKTFDFISKERLSTEKMTSQINDYIKKEIKFMKEIGFLNKEFEFKQAWNTSKIECLLTNNSSMEVNTDKTSVSIQESISSSPLLVGKFFNYFE